MGTIHIHPLLKLESQKPLDRLKRIITKCSAEREFRVKVCPTSKSGGSR